MQLSVRGMYFRASLIFVCFAGFFSLIAFRLIQLQVWKNPELELLAKKQFIVTGKKARYRLSLLDRNGEELAVSIPLGSVYARPRLIRNKQVVSRKLSKLLGGPPKMWLAKLKTDKPFIWIRRQISKETLESITKEKIQGLFVQSENKRIYPNETLASHVLGFTDIDGEGISGLEKVLNKELLSKQPQYQVIRDGKGNLSYVDNGYFKKQYGHSGVTTTIDRRLQNALEEEIETAMRATRANSIFATVMDPNTGEILAMGQRPSFDPNGAGKSVESSLLNRQVSYLYEPGSTMKVFFAAEAIEAGLLHKDTLIDCGNGEIKIGAKRIREAEANHRYSILPLDKVIRFSSNIGAVKVAQKLGARGVQNALDRFGFSSKTGIELPGEVSSAVKPAEFFNPFNLASVGFGQGIAVTPIQMVRAFATIANGGYAVRPHLLMSSNKDFINNKRVVSAKTSEIMRKILLEVTEGQGGTGAMAKIPGVHIAGKTGTAQKYEFGSGYSGGKYFSSFVGMLPANRPEFVISVMVDEPSSSYYASVVAVPLFKKIAMRTIQILDRMPLADRKHLSDSRPNTFLGKKDQSPVQPALALPPAFPALVSTVPGEWIMPDLKGMSMRDCFKLLGKLSQSLKMAGTGYMNEQDPAPGSPITVSTPIVLTFTPEG